MLTPYSHWMIGLCFTVLTTGVVWGQTGLIKSAFIYEEAPFPSCPASILVETQNGIVAAWFGGTAERHPDVGIWVSRFEDGSWTEPVEVANCAGKPAILVTAITSPLTLLPPRLLSASPRAKPFVLAT